MFQISERYTLRLELSIQSRLSVTQLIQRVIIFNLNQFQSQIWWWGGTWPTCKALIRVVFSERRWGGRVKCPPCKALIKERNIQIKRVVHSKEKEKEKRRWGGNWPPCKALKRVVCSRKTVGGNLAPLQSSNKKQKAQKANSHWGIGLVKSIARCTLGKFRKGVQRNPLQFWAEAKEPSRSTPDDAEHMGGQWQNDWRPSSRTFPDLVSLFSLVLCEMLWCDNFLFQLLTSETIYLVIWMWLCATF